MCLCDVSRYPPAFPDLCPPHRPLAAGGPVQQPAVGGHAAGCGRCYAVPIQLRLRAPRTLCPQRAGEQPPGVQSGSSRPQSSGESTASGARPLRGGGGGCRRTSWDQGNIVDEIFTGRTFDLFFLMAKIVQINYLDFSKLCGLPIGFRENAEQIKHKIMESLAKDSNH